MRETSVWKREECKKERRGGSWRTRYARVLHFFHLRRSCHGVTSLSLSSAPTLFFLLPFSSGIVLVVARARHRIESPLGVNVIFRRNKLRGNTKNRHFADVGPLVVIKAFAFPPRPYTHTHRHKPFSSFVSIQRRNRGRRPRCACIAPLLWATEHRLVVGRSLL